MLKLKIQASGREGVLVGTAGLSLPCVGMSCAFVMKGRFGNESWNIWVFMEGPLSSHVPLAKF